jgi:hypothetical protein
MAVSNVDKLLVMIEKAQTQLLDAADSLDACIAECSSVGGQIAQSVPPHIQADIDKITAIVESTDGSSLSKLIELIENMPIRAVKSQSPSERREARKNDIDLNPNTGSGPQSAMTPARESFDWRSLSTRGEPEYEGAGLSWEKLNESKVFSHQDDEPMIQLNKEPINSFAYRQKIRETIDNDYNEITDDEGEPLREGMRLEQVDLSSLTSMPGSIDALPGSALNFTGLREGGTLIDNT